MFEFSPAARDFPSDHAIERLDEERFESEAIDLTMSREFETDVDVCGRTDGGLNGDKSHGRRQQKQFFFASFVMLTERVVVAPSPLGEGGGANLNLQVEPETGVRSALVP